MSIQLLDKTRKLTKTLHNNTASTVNFSEICGVLGGLLSSNVLALSKTGKVLGLGYSEGVETIHILLADEIGDRIDTELNERFLGILSTKENVNLETLGFEPEQFGYQAIVLPIITSGERLGTMFLYRNTESYGIDDIILAEYTSTIVALEMMRAVDEEQAESERQLQNVRLALNALSNSEISAIRHIFEELEGKEGILIASKIADRAGLTRSVIVNALRKMESAGIIESRSSGMRGTFIRVVNDNVYEELDRMKD